MDTIAHTLAPIVNMSGSVTSKNGLSKIAGFTTFLFYMNLADQGSDGFTEGHAHDVAVGGEIEDYDRELVIPAHRYG